MMVVAKFGGSSLSCAAQFQKVKNIVISDPKRTVVVVSALGKRNSNDTKITDLLYILHAHLKFSVPYDDIWNMLYSRFVEVKESLNIDYDITTDLDNLKNELNKNISQDYLVSRGEFLTAKLMSNFLGYDFVDSKDIIVFNYDGKIDYVATEAKTREAYDKHKTMVVPGFYGSYPNGNIKLFSRGGSDVTGSIIAKCLNALMYENWTDVSGIMAADPRIVENPKTIDQVTYTELRELSYMGANVLHEETIFPVQELNIPINIKNTNEPTHKGTIIKQVCDANDNVITGIAGKKGFKSFTIFKNHMSNEVGFLRKTLSIFEKYNVSIEHVPSGIDSFAVIVASESVEKIEYELVADLKQELEASVTIDDDIALVAIVGRNMAKRSGICAQVFNVLGDAKISVKMLAQGPLELNIIVGIKSSDYTEAIKELYQHLVK